MTARPFRPTRSLTPVEASYHQLQHVIARCRRTREGRIEGLPGGYLGAALRGLTRALGVPDGSVVPWLGVDHRAAYCPTCELPVRTPRWPVTVVTPPGVEPHGITIHMSGPPPGAAGIYRGIAEEQAALLGRLRREGRLR